VTTEAVLGEPTTFDRDTAVEALGDGRYGVRFDPRWRVIRGPNGGYIAAILTRAIRAAVADDARMLRSLTVHFLSVPTEGEGVATVRIERTGRSLSTVSARLEQDGKVVAVALAALAGAYPAGVAYEDARMPDVPLPEDIVVTPPGPGEFDAPFRHNFTIHPAIGPKPFTSADRAVTGAWMKLREERPIDEAIVVALCDSWWPAPYAVSDRPLVAPTIDLTVHVRAALPLAWDDLLVEVRSDVARDGYFEEDVRLFTRTGLLVAHSRQLALAL
jgi:acyl-CoA thioesterase